MRGPEEVTNAKAQSSSSREGSLCFVFFKHEMGFSSFSMSMNLIYSSFFIKEAAKGTKDGILALVLHVKD